MTDSSCPWCALQPLPVEGQQNYPFCFFLQKIQWVWLGRNLPNMFLFQILRDSIILSLPYQTILPTRIVTPPTYCCCSVAKSCLTQCSTKDCSAPGFLVLHYLPELGQTHVLRVGDAIQPSPPLSYLSPPAFNLFQHQGLFQWVSLHTRGPKYWSFSFSINPSIE